MVSTQVDILVGMLTQGRVHINGFHPWIKVCHYITDGRQLGISAALRLVGTIELDSGGDNHTIDIHLITKHLFIFISCLCIAYTPLRTTTIRHQGTYLVTLADDNNTFVGYLRILISIDMILILVNGHTVSLLPS